MHNSDCIGYLVRTWCWEIDKKNTGGAGVHLSYSTLFVLLYWIRAPSVFTVSSSVCLFCAP